MSPIFLQANIEWEFTYVQYLINIVYYRINLLVIKMRLVLNF